MKAQNSRRQEIIKIRAEINAFKTKNTVEQIMKPEPGSLKELTNLINP